MHSKTTWRRCEHIVHNCTFLFNKTSITYQKKKKKPTGCRCELTNKNVFYILMIDQEKIGLLVQDSGNLETWGFKRIQRPFALFV